jgi:hypothetical protein
MAGVNCAALLRTPPPLVVTGPAVVRGVVIVPVNVGEAVGAAPIVTGLTAHGADPLQDSPGAAPPVVLKVMAFGRASADRAHAEPV